MISSRLREHSKTIYALAEEGARVVVLSHQGRPGEEEFISLKRHADFIKKFIDKPVKFVTWEEDYVKAIREMKNCEVLVLDNTRFQKEELDDESSADHSNDAFIKKLGSVGNIFVQDALSVSHRSQASVVGFKKYMPCVVGPLLQKELEALDKLEGQTKNGKLLVLGGSKVADSVKLLSHMLENKMCQEVCIGGLFGELFLLAKGIDLGAKKKFFEEKGLSKFVPDAKKILENHGKKLILPIDLAYEDPQVEKRIEVKIGDLPIKFATMDIGKDTTELFKKKIRASDVVVFNGPMGVYENPSFAIGTKKILEALAFHRCYSILGGGDTEKAITSFGLLQQDFSHVSLAGKALLQYLSGEPLPGLEILEKK